VIFLVFDVPVSGIPVSGVAVLGVAVSVIVGSFSRLDRGHVASGRSLDSSGSPGEVVTWLDVEPM
jgi:hypothetical protein